MAFHWLDDSLSARAEQGLLRQQLLQCRQDLCYQKQIHHPQNLLYLLL